MPFFCIKTISKCGVLLPFFVVFFQMQNNRLKKINMPEITKTATMIYCLLFSFKSETRTENIKKMVSLNTTFLR